MSKNRSSTRKSTRTRQQGAAEPRPCTPATAAEAERCEVGRVLLVNPHGTEQEGFTNPPLGLLYIAGTLLRHGFEVRVVDGCLDGLTAIRTALIDFRPDLVGITCLTPGRKNAVACADLAKSLNPSVKVVMGGVHPTIMYQQMMEHYPSIDYIVLGEGEITFLELAQGKDPAEVAGLVCRKDGRITKTGPRDYVANLDDLPFPAWHLVDLSRYPAIDTGVYNGIDLQQTPRISVVFSRGCKGHCNFCSTWWVWKGWRRRSARNMADEIEMLYRDHGVRHFCFADDSMTVDRQATIDLCDEIIARSLKIVFHVTTRTDCVDELMLRKLKDAGCYKIAFGIETGSQKLLESMNKENDLESTERAITLAKQAGLLTSALIMVGNPGETEETIGETNDLLRRTQPHNVCTVGGVWIFPGTKLYQSCKRQGFIDDDFWLGDEPYKVYTMEHSPEKLHELTCRAVDFSPRRASCDSDVLAPTAELAAQYDAMYEERRATNPDALTLDWWKSHFATRTACETAEIRGRVLDLGCGTGEIDIWLAREKAGVEVDAVDISGSAIATAREHLAGEPEDVRRRVRFHESAIEKLPFEDSAFDACFISHTLEHVPDHGTVFAELSRVIKPGGAVVAVIPRGRNFDDPTHCWHFEPDQFQGQLELFGENVKVWTSPDGRQLAARMDLRPKPRVICMMRIKNEEAWIGRALESAARFVDGFVILDDGSTDRTPEICRAFPKVLSYEYQSETTRDEARDKDRLYQAALDQDPDWILALDGDEVFEDIAPITMVREILACPAEVSVLGFNFLYMWDREDRHRVDTIYANQRHPRLMRVKGLDSDPRSLRFMRTKHGANFHCGSLPVGLPGQVRYIDVYVKHYGYFEREQRERKREFYERSDPHTAATGFYDKLTNEDGMVLWPWRERQAGDVLYSDNRPDGLIHALHQAGNTVPLAGLFLLPGANRHLDVGSNVGRALRGLDPKRITCIERYAPAVQELRRTYPSVVEGDARQTVEDLAAKGELFDCVTLIDFIEHLDRGDGERLLDTVERLATRQVMLFVPIETDELVRSQGYKDFMKAAYDIIPKDQHSLQTHRSRWSPEDFQSRGYDIFRCDDFHMPGFHAFFAVKCMSTTDRELSVGCVNAFLARQQQPAQSAGQSAGMNGFGALGPNSRIIDPVMVVNPDRMFIGDNVCIGHGARLETIKHHKGVNYDPKLIIEDGASMELSVHIGAANLVHIGKWVMIAGRVTILDHDHGYEDITMPPMFQPLSVGTVRIDDGAWLGENVVVCKNVHIGKHAVIGANSVVTKDIPPYSVAVGMPARVVKQYNPRTRAWERVTSETSERPTLPQDTAESAQGPERQELVSIVVLARNQLSYTKQCIDSIFRHTKTPFELIVVDNASTDGTSKYFARLRRQHEDSVRHGRPSICKAVKVISHDHNLGFAAGNNSALGSAEGDYVLFVNNDVVAAPGWLEKMVACAQSAPSIGIVGPMTNSISGPQLIEKPSYDTGSLSGLERFAGEWARQHANDVEPFWRVVGFCMLVKRQVIEKIGGLDTRYGTGNFEDDDFCIRAAVAGFRCAIARDAYVHHFGSATFSGERIDYRDLLLKNWEIFKRKWGIAQETAYGSEWNLARVIECEFDRALHYCDPSGDQAAETAECEDSEVARLQAMLEGDPSNIRTMNQLASAYMQAGGARAAIDVLARALETAPDSGLIHNNLAVLLTREGKLGQAAEHACRAVELRPGDSDALDSLRHIRNALKKQGADRGATDRIRSVLEQAESAQVGGVKLSVCLIVKNEEDFIEDCLKSVKDIASEIVVVDTGSTDGTIEIVNRYGAKVHSFEWNDSFADARNEALTHASGDWILFVDADERLDASAQDIVRNAIERPSAEGYALLFHNYYSDRPRPEVVHRACRLFRNKAGYRYESRIHEHVVPSIEKSGGEVVELDAVIHHYGYNPEIVAKKGKSEKYLRLLHDQLAEQPDDLHTLHHLWTSYANAGEWGNALPHARRSSELVDRTSTIYGQTFSGLSCILLNLGRAGEALETTERALGTGYRDPEVLLVRGNALSRLGRADEAVESYNAALELGRQGTWLGDPEAYGYKAYLGLALAHLTRSDYAGAVEAGRKLVEEKPDDADARSVLAKAYTGLGGTRATQNELGDALECFTHALELDPSSAEACFSAGDVLYAIGAYEKAAESYQAGLMHCPTHAQAFFTIGNCYFQMGVYEAAAVAYRQALALDPDYRDAENNLSLAEEASVRAAAA